LQKTPYLSVFYVLALAGTNVEPGGQRGKGAGAEHAVAGTLLAFTRSGIALLHVTGSGDGAE